MWWGFFVEFHDVGSFERSLNATFIVLVPKKGGRLLQASSKGLSQ